MPQLHEEQNYVFERAKELGIELKILHHKEQTTSCREKLGLLNKNPKLVKKWTLGRIVKALYFSRNNQPYIGVITPEFGINVEPKKIFPEVLGISNSTAERYRVNTNHVPIGMSWGTCTPFPLISSMDEEEISDLIIIAHPKINDELVDISVGGIKMEDREISMHLKYKSIYEILRRRFGNRIHLYRS